MTDNEVGELWQAHVKYPVVLRRGIDGCFCTHCDLICKLVKERTRVYRALWSTINDAAIEQRAKAALEQALHDFGIKELNGREVCR